MLAEGAGVLRDVVLCTTGLPGADKSRCSAIVKALGGRYSGDLTREVTHLVATEWGSPKYKKAVELGLEIVRPEWVYACEEISAGTASPIEAPAEGRFRPLYFEGFKVTVSGAMEREERSILQAEVEGAGGTWLPALTPDTHPLAATHPEGSKYDAAREAGICVVSLRWCWASVEERSRVELGVFPLQADDEVPPFRSGWRGGWLAATAPAPAPGIMPRHEVDPGSDGVEHAGVVHPTHSESGAVTAREGSRGTKLIPAVSGTSADPADIVTVDIDSETVQGRYLDSCLIHPVGFERAQMKDLVKLIRRGGGTRLVKPDNQVTHIVASVRAALDGLTHLRAKIVTVSWLVESCKAGRVAATDTYQITKQQAWRASAVVTSATTRRPSPVNLEGGSSLSTIFAGSRSTMVPRPGPEAIVEETRCPGRSSPRDGQQHELSSSAASGRSASTWSRRKRKNQLSGKRFTLSHALTEAEERKARKLVEEHGGTISQSPAGGLAASTGNAGNIFAICPHGQSTNTFSLPTFTSPGRSASSSSRSNVTLQWVEDCCHHTMKPGEHADPSVCPAFTPLPFKLPLPNADKCVVCVSGFTGMGRKRIQVLLALVGATACERLSKQTTTMLVSLKPEGPKYDSAVQWRVPIVTVDWLYESVIDGRLENPEPGTDLVGNAATAKQAALPPRDERHVKHNSGHSVAETSIAVGIAGEGESNCARTEAHPKLRTGTGNAESSIPQVDAGQDTTTTALPRLQRSCEDVIVEQPEPNSQVTMSRFSERRTLRGSQPLPLQHSAAATAPQPASQGLPVVAEKSTERNDQADQAKRDLDVSGSTDAKNKLVAAKREKDVSKRVSADLGKSSNEQEFTNDDNRLGTDSNKCKSTEPNLANGVRSDSPTAPQDNTHSPVQSVEQRQDDTMLADRMEPHEKTAARGLASATARESPRWDDSRSLKRSLSDSQVTDSGGKENLKNICADDVAHPATAPEIRSEPLCSAPASTSTSSSTQRQKPDLSLLVKDFKRKFQKKVETPREHTLLPAAPAEGMMSGDSFYGVSEPRRVTRSEVERDTTDRPGEGINENGKRSQLEDGTDCLVPPGGTDPKRVSRRHRVEAATASELQQRLTARKVQQSSGIAAATLSASGGNSDDEDMYAESQMVVYDRSFGTTAPGSSSTSNVGMPPPPVPNGPKSSPELATKSSPNARQTRRSTRRGSGSGGVAGPEGAATVTAQASTAGETPKSKDTAPKIFMISGLTTQAKKSVTQDIRRLGGTVMDKQSWDKRCTHLITDEVKRVEKTLAACASGRWVVTVEYVKASLRAKRFVDEKQYEHGASGGRRDDESHAHRGNELLPDTPHRCRILRETVPALNGGLFSGMKALVALADNRKTDIVVRVLDSGGAAQVATCSGAPATDQLQSATAVFVDANQFEGVKKHASTTGASVYTSDSLSGLLSCGHFDAEDGLYKFE